MAPGGRVHIATDHEDYFAWIARLFREDERFVPTTPFEPTEEERTDFELTFRKMGKSVFRCSFQKKGDGQYSGSGTASSNLVTI
jgi:tRNA G46 methylase TrmB